MSEQEQPAASGPPGPEGYGMPPRTSPLPGRSRSSAVGAVLTSRGAGWAAATLLAGAVVALSILLAESPGAGPVAVVRGAPVGPGRAVFAGPGPAVSGGPGGEVFAGPGGPAKISVAPPAFARPGQISARLRPAPVIQRIAPPAAGPGLAPAFGPVAGPGAGLGFRIAPRQGGAQFMTAIGEVVTGTVTGVSGSKVTLTTVPGQTVTVTEQASTVYRKAGKPASASAVTKGARIWVLGSGSGSALSATVIAVLS